jgi:hypothetical protein
MVSDWVYAVASGFSSSISSKLCHVSGFKNMPSISHCHLTREAELMDRMAVEGGLAAVDNRVVAVDSHRPVM